MHIRDKIVVAALAVCTLTTVTRGAPAPRRVGPVAEPVPTGRFARVFHVSRTTGDDQTGEGSAGKPWSSVRHALAQARDAGAANRYAIFVAAGTYGEGTLEMKPSVDLYGGFDAKEWSRDVARHATVLDVRRAGRVVIGADDARLDGFTIRGGSARGPGGGILCDRTAPTIANNMIVDNETLEPAGYIHGLLHQLGNDGGAIACLNGAAPVIANNLIAGNSTGVGGGGGIATANLATPTIVDNVIVGNVTGRTDRSRSRSSNGGAIACSNLPIRGERDAAIRARISGNVILNNHAGGRSDAGGIYCEYDANPEISHNLILGNRAEDDGGGIYVMKSSEPLIAANVIAGNHGGGGVRLSKDGRALIENNVIFADEGGGVNCVGSWMRLAHNTIVNNAGGGVAYENLSHHLRHSVVSGNIVHGNEGKQLRDAPAGSLDAADHNLIAGGGRRGEGNIDADPMFVDDAVAGDAERAEYDAGRAQTTLTLTAAPPGDGTDPLVGRPIRAGERWGVIAAVDGKRLTVWGDLTAAAAAGPLRFEVPPTYHLRAGSPCIDAGPPAAGATSGPSDDMDGDRRPGPPGRSDIGADEHTAVRAARS